MFGLEASVCCLSLLATLGGEKSRPPFYLGCIVKAHQTSDVASAVKTISFAAGLLNLIEGSHQARCRFAIRSGGHSKGPGFANIAGGVTLDLTGLNKTDLSQDGVAKVGPGATWDHGYGVLDPLKLMVAGGWDAGVGVGVNYGVVLANGSVVNANERENPDLLFALRGGQNNFGVVTRVDLQTFPMDDMWGGMTVHNTSTIDKQLEAFARFAEAESYDEYSSMFTIFAFQTGQPLTIINAMAYTKPVENPTSLQGFTKIPSLTSSLRLTSMHDLSVEMAKMQPRQVRQREGEITHAATMPMLKAVWERWSARVAALEDPDLSSVTVWGLTLEPLHLQMRPQWQRPRQDAKVEAAAKLLLDNIAEDSKRLGADDDFVCINYAAPWQDPFLATHQYDPKALFGSNVPGGFKIQAARGADERTGQPASDMPARDEI